MQINLLKKGYKNSSDFYEAFVSGSASLLIDYIDSGRHIIVDKVYNFPIYAGKGKEEDRRSAFLELIHGIEAYFLGMNREVLFDEIFWHSYLCLYQREYLLQMYPQILESEKNFRNIVIKNFDWENYIYKAILMAQYVNKHVENDSKDEFYNLIIDNLDFYNYIIKYEIFRNSNFLVNILEIVKETNTGSIIKEKIKNDAYGDRDLRYGRMIVYEFNKSYPVILAPMLSKERLKQYYLEFLKYYYDIDEKKKENILESVDKEVKEENEIHNNFSQERMEIYVDWLKKERFMSNVIDVYVNIITEYSKFCEIHSIEEPYENYNILAFQDYNIKHNLISNKTQCDKGVRYFCRLMKEIKTIV